MASKTPLWLDCDPGGDDAIAIMLACFNDALDLIGISTVSGNKVASTCAKNARRILYSIGKSHIPVVAGCEEPLIRTREEQQFHGSNGLAETEFPEPESINLVDTNFVEFMVSNFKKQSEKVVLAAVGPLTNIAVVLRAYPECKNYIEKIVIMGGSINFGNITPTSEFNIWYDPEAAEIVFRSGVPIQLVPLDCTYKTGCPPAHLEEIGKWGSNFGGLLHSMLTYFQKKYQALVKREACMHDACALMVAIEPSIFEGKNYFVSVETGSKLCDGRTIVDLFGSLGRAPNAWVAENVDNDKYWKILMEALIQADKNSPLNKQQN